MKAKDSIEDLTRMVKMHDNVLERLDKAIKEKRSIEACWLCYACFESRINRTIEKVSEKCDGRYCHQNNRVGIQTKIDCLKRLLHQKYLGMDNFDINLFGQIKAWCKKRNTLVHALITLNNYQNIDEKFLNLAKEGLPIVISLYEQTTKFRNNYYAAEEIPAFPQEANDKCSLVKSRRKNDRTTHAEAPKPQAEEK